MHRNNDYIQRKISDAMSRLLHVGGVMQVARYDANGKWVNDQMLQLIEILGEITLGATHPGTVNRDGEEVSASS